MTKLGGWRGLWLAVPITLAGCASEVKKAEERYAIVEKSGSADAVCDEGRKLAAAYLEAGDAEAYNLRGKSAEMECSLRRSEEQAGVFRMPDGSTKAFTADDLDNVIDTTSNAKP